MLKRRSVRDFTDAEIDDGIIEQLLKSAMAAPIACNMQPWMFYVVKNKELQEKLRHVSRYSNMNSDTIILQPTSFAVRGLCKISESFV